MSSGWKRPLQLAALCWVVFAAVLVSAYWLPAGRWADAYAVEGFLNLQRPSLNHIATPVAHLADPGPFAIWTVLLAGIALYRRRPRHALAVILLLGGANLITQLLKVLLAHPRPHDIFGKAQLGVDAFPSGHATASMALAFAAVLVASQAWRPVVAIAGAMFALGVSESVMLLAWHFPSDVAGGFLVASSVALATLAGLRAADERWPERTGREAARRALEAADLRRIAGFATAVVAAGAVAFAIVAGDRAFHFADRHTTAVVAALAVAAMSAVLPASLVILGGRRPSQ